MFIKTNRYINGRQETAFPYRDIPINKCRKNEKKRKTSLEEYSNSCFKQNLLIVAEKVGESLKRNRISEYFKVPTPKYLLITKKK